MPDEITLARFLRSDQGTIGALFHMEHLCWTIEPPWRDNLSNLSCIPPGRYWVEMEYSPYYAKELYTVRDVPDRSVIRIHAGNVAGNTDLGYRTHSKGCILPGTRRGSLWGQTAVLASAMALNEFVRLLGGQPFELNILPFGSGGNQ